MDNGNQSLSGLRLKVRELDDRLFQLFAERQELARQIGACKHAANLPIKDYKVEKEVIDRARARARELGLYEGMTADAAQLLIKYSVMVQDDHRTQRNRRAAGESQRILIAGGRGRMGQWLSEFFESFGHAVSHFDPEAKASSPYPLIDDLVAGARASDVVVLATPISATPALLTTLAAARVDALVFDICSLKTPLVPALHAALAAGLKVTSVHPMFGPQVDVLTGRNIIICSTGDDALAARTRALFEGTTAQLIGMPLERHDELMSYVLGLSHLTSLVFADVLRGSGVEFAELRGVASTTFNAQLAVSHSVVQENQDLYFEIQAENRCTPALVSAIANSLAAYGQAIATGDRDAFRALMEHGRLYLDADAAAATRD